MTVWTKIGDLYGIGECLANFSFVIELERKVFFYRR